MWFLLSQPSVSPRYSSPDDGRVHYLGNVEFFTVKPRCNVTFVILAYHKL